MSTSRTSTGPHSSTARRASPSIPVRFFRWRCFTDYGEGLGGDLFVHLISGIMFITGTNTVAVARAKSTGGLFRWKDGRQFPDMIETYYDYPNFRVDGALQLEQRWRRVHRLLRHKGTMIIRDSTLTFSPQNTLPEMEDYSTKGWPEALRKQYEAEWEKDHPLPAPFASKVSGRGRDVRSAAGIQRHCRSRGQLLQRGAYPKAVRGERGLRQQRGHRLPSRELLVLQQEDRDLGCLRQEDHRVGPRFLST